MKTKSKIKEILEDKEKILKFGYLYKRSKYLKFWNLYLTYFNQNLFFRRFMVLTNKSLYSFTNNFEWADCTMNLSLFNCHHVEAADHLINKQFSFVVRENNCDYFFQAADAATRNEWVREIKLKIIESRLIDECDEIYLEKYKNKNNDDDGVAFIV
jgi:hypothetical protein